MSGDDAREPWQGKAKQGRAWFFTYHDPPAVRRGLEWLAGLGVHKYAAQMEEGHETHHAHLQGCIRFEKNRSRKWVVEKIWEPDLERKPKGDWLTTVIDWDGAVKYCTKEDTRTDGPWVMGLDRVERTYAEQRALLAGGRLVDAIEALDPSPYLVPGLARAADILRRPFYGEPRFVYLFGEVDAGKTWYVYNRHEDEDVFPWTTTPGNSSAISRYGGQPVIMFEEFDKLTPFPGAYILQFMDRGLKSVRFVGGASPSSAEVYYFCANLPPWDLPVPRHTRDGILRRLSQRGVVIHAHARTYTEIPLRTEAPWGPLTLRGETGIRAASDEAAGGGGRLELREETQRHLGSL